MKEKMISFLKSIHITNVEDFDLDFDMVGRNRFKKEQIDMIITKETPWKYELLRQFQDGLNTVNYPYFLRFSYRNKPTVEDVMELFQDWYRSIYHVSLSPVLTAVDKTTFNIEFANEEEKEKFSPVIFDFNDFLLFIGYEFLIQQSIKVDDGPVVTKQEMKEVKIYKYNNYYEENVALRKN